MKILGEIPKIMSENLYQNIKNFFKEAKKSDARQDTIQVNSVPCYTLIPSFNFFQLFLMGNALQAFSNRLLAQQTCTRYDMENINDNNFNLNNFLNNQSIVDHKEFFRNILSEHIQIDDENENQEDENKNQEDENRNDEDFQNGLKLGKKEDEFYDRKDWIKKLENYQKSIAFSRDIKFIQLEGNEESNISDQISKKLSDLSSSSKPILFYTTKEVSTSFDFPLKVLLNIKKKVLITFAKKFNIYIDDNEDNLKMYAQKFREKSPSSRIYFQLSFIIGTKNGIPMLIVFDGNKMYKICDNKSEQIKDYEEFSTSIDQIYILYYFINGLDASIQLKNTSTLRSKPMHNNITDSDDILKGYIKYKLDNSWSNHEFNFIELIKESVIYPAFFAFCSGKTLLTAFHGSVILGTDKYSESSIISSFESDEKQNVNEIIKTYGTFTAFVSTLSKFLKSIIDLPNNQDDGSVSTLIKYLFGSIPAHNEIFFDMFVDFLIKIINSKYLKNFGRCQRSFRQYLSMTISNKEDLGFQKENYQDSTFNSIFSLSQRQGENSNSITAVQELDKILNNDDYKQFFDKKVKLEFENVDDVDNSHIKYEPKYKKVPTYTDFLSKEFIFPEIHP